VWSQHLAVSFRVVGEKQIRANCLELLVVTKSHQQVEKDVLLNGGLVRQLRCVSCASITAKLGCMYLETSWAYRAQSVDYQIWRDLGSGVPALRSYRD
jgi:hypothetical protein